MPSPDDRGHDLRDRIVRVAGDLLAAGGQAAVTTRAVGAAAEVQAPTIYRLFGDKRGLLEAVAEQQVRAFIEAKAASAADDLDRDPVEEPSDDPAAELSGGTGDDDHAISSCGRRSDLL